MPTLPDPLPTPPRAERRPYQVTRHGVTTDDPYHWMRDRDDPAVRAYLEAENAHTEAWLAPLADLKVRLFEEIKGRIQETDASAPVADHGWRYYRRTLAGQQYSIHCRRPDRPDPERHPDPRFPVDPQQPPADEMVILDENAEAEGLEFFRLGGLAISPDHRLAAYLADTTGNEVFTLKVRDLETGKDLDDVIPRAAYGLAWHQDSGALLYTVPDDAWRPHQVWRHRLGTDPADDQLVHQEDDERFWLSVGRTRSDRFLVIAAGSSVTSEVRLLEAGDPASQPVLVRARHHGVEYSVDHRHDRLYVTTNADGAEDFKLVTAPIDQPGEWTDLVAHRPGVRLEGVDCFASHLVLYERTEARTQLRIADPDSGEGALIPMDEEVYAAGPGANPDFHTRTLRFSYTSLTTPSQVVDLDLDSGQRTLIKQQPVRGGYDRDHYVCERRWAIAADGARIPISLVRRVDTAEDGTAPCMLYGYGSYEISIDPTFSSARLSLLDRGFVYAIAHVRGGGEMGRRWYEDGKFLAKPNSFSDLVACADLLADDKVVDGSRIAVRGGSAGGLLVGAALNLRPDRFAAAVAQVPFVDVVNTMSDPSIPLTVIEYDEWGNPDDPAYFEVMRSYAPYENIREQPYPAMLVTAGLNDPRVQYWEPAKWVARLRELTTGDAPILLKTELGAGHAGRSGRYDAWRDEAEVLAFVIDRLDAPHEPLAPPAP